MNVSFQGIGQLCATFETSDSSLLPGDPVMVIDDGQVKKGAAGKNLDGVCQSVRGGLATVILGGHAKVAYTGSLTYGLCKLGCAAAGVTASDSGRQVLVLSMAGGLADIIL